MYLAPSTIPGAGLGIYAGVDFGLEEVVMPGDIVVPIDEMPFHSGSTNWEDGVSDFFLWSDYTWDSTIVGGINFDYEGLSGDGEEIEEGAENHILSSVEMASFGLGAMPNCKFGFVNVHSDVTLADTAGLNRYSPANGAFTPYHERVGKAKAPIKAGSEIFEDYGVEYFANRPGLELVPREEDYAKADELLKGLKAVRVVLMNNSKAIPISEVMRDLYDVVKSTWKSRVMNALPEPPPNDNPIGRNFNEFLGEIINNPAIEIEKKGTIRDTKWLKEEGVCMDGLRAGTSDIPHAGRGAFAAKPFQKGERIAPVPLIHMPQREILTKYAPISEDGEATTMRNVSNPVGTQLFMNYVFGHRNSTMLLSPYGHITSLINHGAGQSANARMVWAEGWMRSPELLERSPEALLQHPQAGLGWDLIALCDIEVDEELLIDYGPEWEEAWQKHVADWFAQEKIPTGTALPYLPASELNENKEQVLLEAVKDKVDYSYMGHGVRLHCYYYGNAIQVPHDYDHQYSEAMQECRPVKAYRSQTSNELLFWAEIIEWIEDGKHWQAIVHDVIFDASASIFNFEDDPYNTAHKMPWSFRHAMAIPDDMLPAAWINLPIK